VRPLRGRGSSLESPDHPVPCTLGGRSAGEFRGTTTAAAAATVVASGLSPGQPIRETGPPNTPADQSLAGGRAAGARPATAAVERQRSGGGARLAEEDGGRQARARARAPDDKEERGRSAGEQRQQADGGGGGGGGGSGGVIAHASTSGTADSAAEKVRAAGAGRMVFFRAGADPAEDWRVLKALGKGSSGT
jgi:hypothetical protein